MTIGKRTRPGAERHQRGTRRWARGLATAAIVIAAAAAGTLSLSVSPASAAPSSRVTLPAQTTAAGPSLPGSFAWKSSGVLISPHSDSHAIVSVKDPSVVRYNGRWYVAASVADSSGNYSMEFLSFANWSQANAAQPVYADQTAIGGGYKTAPQLFYFAPRHLWYVIYQTGDNIGYSTNPDIANPLGWSASRYFYSGMPATIASNIGPGYWVDSWSICGKTDCYLFSMDDNGHLYRSQTSLQDFPNGMSEPVIAASNPARFSFFEADAVYKVADSNQYLLLVEGIASTGRRIYTSYTSDAIDGTWTPLANTENSPFIGAANVTFDGTAWTQDFSSGELIRDNYDQTPTVNACHLSMVYQGEDPSASTSYNLLPWRIGMATETNGC
jgi:endo-1,4-beta-xylanase